MLLCKNIVSLTAELLAHNAFGHLKDDEISAIHYQILKLREPVSGKQQNLLLNLWKHSNSDDLPAALLHRCNILLLQHGHTPIEELMAFGEG